MHRGAGKRPADGRLAAAETPGCDGRRRAAVRPEKRPACGCAMVAEGQGNRGAPAMTDVAAIVAKLSEAQRDTLVYAWPYPRSEEHPSELQSLMRISYAVFCLKKKK